MREAIAAESGVAVEAVRARARRRSEESEDDQNQTTRKDPGYSQEVRYACQQRMVQLIPVRKAAMASVVAALVSLWLTLLLAHYLVNVRGTSISNLAIAHFFHIRSPHSLSHWLGVQLWMFTAIVSLLVYQLRRHKLDDYRAKYRIWLFLAGGAAFSSFDASTSALYILGSTIDPWTQRQFSLPGWPVVLGTFASLVGVLGLRLCSELKSSPGSVSLWLAGLLSWAYSAVLGTGLFKTEMTPAVLDMVVGATWLGGILAVFLGSTLYLRHIYIQAQKRFALRNKWLAEQQKWQMPKLSLEKLNPKNMAAGLTSKLRRKQASNGDDVDQEQDVAPKRTVTSDARSSSTSSNNAFKSDADFAPSTASGTNRNANDRLTSSTSSNKPSSSIQKADDQAEIEFDAVEDQPKKRGWLPWKRNREEIGAESNEYSDVGAHPRVRDKGLNSGFEKVRSGGSAEPEETSTDRRSSTSKSPSSISKDPAEASKKRNWNLFSRRSAVVGTPEAKAEMPTAKSAIAGSNTTVDEAAKEKKRSWSMGMFKRSNKPKAAAKKTAESASSTGESPKKKGFFSRSRNSDSKDANSKSTDPKVAKPTTEKKKSWFGFMDALTLKPPATSDAVPTKPQTQVSIPSTSSQSNKPTSAPLPNNGRAVAGNLDDDDDDSAEYRNLSKAERKRLRRQQQQNRAA